MGSFVPEDINPPRRTREKSAALHFSAEARKSLFKFLILLFAFAFVIIWLHYQLAAKGYEINQLKAEIKELQNENQMLSLKKEELADLKRIEEVATKELGMSYPDQDQLQVIEQP